MNIGDNLFYIHLKERAKIIGKPLIDGEPGLLLKYPRRSDNNYFQDDCVKTIEEIEKLIDSGCIILEHRKIEYRGNWGLILNEIGGNLIILWDDRTEPEIVAGRIPDFRVFDPFDISTCSV